MFYITGSFIILYYCHKRQNIFYGSEMEGISRSAGLQLQKVLVPSPQAAALHSSTVIRGGCVEEKSSSFLRMRLVELQPRLE